MNHSGLKRRDKFTEGLDFGLIMNDDNLLDHAVWS